MSKVPSFSDPCKELINRIYYMEEHDPNSEDFTLLMDEDEKRVYFAITQSSKEYSEEQINRVKKAYQKQLSKVAKVMISEKLNACEGLNEDDSLQVPSIVSKALVKLNSTDQEYHQFLIDLKIIELFCQNKETVWKSILYIHKKNLKSSFRKLEYLNSFFEILKNSGVSKAFQSQVANISNLYFTCTTNNRITLNFILAEDLETIPDDLHNLLSNVWNLKIKDCDSERILNHEITKIFAHNKPENNNNN